MRSEILRLTLALRQSLVTNLPALVDEVNSQIVDEETGEPFVPIVLPLPDAGSTATVALGIRTDMLKRELAELPARARGVYLRRPTDELERPVSQVVFPFTVDIYLGGTNADDLYVQALKWATVLDMWQERYGWTVRAGYTTEEAPDLEVSYSLELRGGEFRQLVTRTGVFTTHE